MIKRQMTISEELLPARYLRAFESEYSWVSEGSRDEHLRASIKKILLSYTKEEVRIKPDFESRLDLHVDSVAMLIMYAKCKQRYPPQRASRKVGKRGSGKSTSRLRRVVAGLCDAYNDLTASDPTLSAKDRGFVALVEDIVKVGQLLADVPEEKHKTRLAHTVQFVLKNYMYINSIFSEP